MSLNSNQKRGQSSPAAILACAVAAIVLGCDSSGINSPIDAGSLKPHFVAVLTPGVTCGPALSANPLTGPLLAVSGFGRRYYNDPKPHEGVDFAANNVPVHAVESGTVTFAGWTTPPIGFDGGFRIEITSPVGRTTKYLHLKENSNLVAKGDPVTVGMPIAVSGNTNGIKTNPGTVPAHLHFAVEKADGKNYDPMTCMYDYSESVIVLEGGVARDVFRIDPNGRLMLAAEVQTPGGRLAACPPQGSAGSCRSVYWKSLNSNVVQIPNDRVGELIAVNEGSALIEVAASLNTVDTIEVVVGPIPVNVALNKPVLLVGLFGSLAPGANQAAWQASALAPASPGTVTDGLFLPAGNTWHQNTIWWDATLAASNSIGIDLVGRFDISRLVVQADNNDQYAVSYRDGSGTWNQAWLVPPVGGGGMHTRELTLPAPFTATHLLIVGVGGDALYSVSELQAWGISRPRK